MAEHFDEFIIINPNLLIDKILSLYYPHQIFTLYDIVSERQEHSTCYGISPSIRMCSSSKAADTPCSICINNNTKIKVGLYTYVNIRSANKCNIIINKELF